MAKALGIGDAMPTANVKMESVMGTEVALGEVKGAKGTLMIFSCSHCPWVKAWETGIVDIGNELPGKGIGVIAVNSNDPRVYPDDTMPEMVKRAKERGFTFPYVVDATSGVARAFGASHTPEAFLFDASGELVYHGTIDDNARDASAVEHHYLRDAAAALIAGKAVPVAETKALGCSIALRP